MRCNKLPSIQNFVNGSKASLRLPLGGTYQKIYIYLQGTGVTKANISNIVLRLNNKEFQRWASGTDLDVLNAYKGNTTNASIMVIDFTERKAREELGLSLGTIAACPEAGVQDFTLEFDISGATVTAIPVAFADVESPSANTIVQRVMFQQKTLAGAVQDQIYVPFAQAGFLLKRILIKNTYLASVRVRRDGVEVYEDLPVALANLRATDFGQTPVAGWHVVDFIPDTLQGNTLNTANTVVGGKAIPVSNLDIRMTTTAADTVTIYVEGYALNGQL